MKKEEGSAVGLRYTRVKIPEEQKQCMKMDSISQSQIIFFLN